MKKSLLLSLFLMFGISVPLILAQSNAVITGRVSDGILPIAGARVIIQADTAWVTTDSQGRFRLPVDRYRSNPVPVMVGKKGWFNGSWRLEKGRRNAELILAPVPQGDNPHYRWIDPAPSSGGMMGTMMGGGSQTCGSCHENYYDWWKESSMAKTTRNQRVLDQYKDAGAARKICADCHAPAAAVQAPGQTDLLKVAQQGGVETEGVFCDFCHKIKDVKVSFKPGVQTLKFSRIERPSRRLGMMSTRPVMAYGSLADVVTPPMAAGFNPALSKSEFCSSCHLNGRELPGKKTWDYKAVYPDASPEEFQNGRIVPNQWTYREWKNWQESLAENDPNKGQQCQDCHMNWTQDMLPYDKYIVRSAGGGMMNIMIRRLRVRRDPSTIHPHKFEGATVKRLQNTAFLLLRPSLQGNRLSVMVSVTNTNAGHRLPTGVTFRNMLLLVQATDSTGKILSQTGGPKIPEWAGKGSPGKGNYAGLPGVGYARITADDHGNINVPFWEATKIVQDNRLVPRKPDVQNFVFNAAKTRNYITVKATLIYRKSFKKMADKYGWDTGDVVMEKTSKVVYK